jgi:spermidine/putrescine transport system substrate-binding protein
MKIRDSKIKLKFFTFLLISASFLVVFGNARTLLAAEPRELVFLNWTEYIDPEIVEEFEKKFQVRVKEVFFETDEQRDEKVSLTNGKGYDVVILNGGIIASYAKRQWITPLDHTKIPNVKHIDPRWIKSHPKTQTHSIPYFWGTVGIAYRQDLVKEDVISWSSLYKPQANLRNKIMMINDSVETISMALKYLGYPINSPSSKELAEAEKLLLAQKPFVTKYSSLVLTEESHLVTGTIWMAMGYSGDALTLQEYNPDIKYVVPQEGTAIWIDHLAVMAQSDNKDLAYDFINFLNEPEHAARLAIYLNYASPNISANDHLPAEHLNNQVIYPNDAILAKSEFFQKISPRIKKKFNTIFSKLLK